MRHSASDIGVILHYYTSSEPHPRVDAPAVKDAIIKFTRAGILKESDKKGGYEVTERGYAWIDLICLTPYPVQVWIDPRTKAKGA